MTRRHCLPKPVIATRNCIRPESVNQWFSVTIGGVGMPLSLHVRNEVNFPILIQKGTLSCHLHCSVIICSIPAYSTNRRMKPLNALCNMQFNTLASHCSNVQKKVSCILHLWITLLPLDIWSHVEWRTTKPQIVTHEVCSIELNIAQLPVDFRNSFQLLDQTSTCWAGQQSLHEVWGHRLEHCSDLFLGLRVNEPVHACLIR